MFRVPGDVQIDFRTDVPWHGIRIAEAIVGRPLKRPGIPWVPLPAVKRLAYLQIGRVNAAERRRAVVDTDYPSR